MLWLSPRRQHTQTAEAFGAERCPHGFSTLWRDRVQSNHSVHLVQQVLQVYSQSFMRSRLLVSLLVLLLSGANSSATSVCAAYCASSAPAETAVVHHHMESHASPMSISHHIHTTHHGLRCSDCPPNSWDSLNADCTTLVEIQAIKEGSFCLDVPTGLANVGALTPAASHDLVSAYEGEQHLLRNASSPIITSSPASPPLRI
ncbi:MAG: hypothetical protein JWO91_3949 [Acidobacteriaceae bacterium]|nr:hypothetical protein [Acidobacteriaceae bacterium]